MVIGHGGLSQGAVGLVYSLQWYPLVVDSSQGGMKAKPVNPPASF